MRVAYLIAGAGRMYCGACMRDNRLAAKLIEQGRDVVLIPLYMPIRTDEVDVSTRRVFYGGLNVYLQQKSALYRRIPKAVGRLLDSPRLLRGLGRMMTNAAPDDIGALTVSVLAGEDGAQRAELVDLIAALQDIKPAVINLPNLMFVGTAQALKTALNVPILCTLAGEDAYLDALGEPHRSQAFELIRKGIEHVDGFIAPSNYYASHAIEHFGLDKDRVHHVPMGIQVNGVGPPADPPAEPFTIGYLAAISPEKGLAELCEAFVLLRNQGRNCRLRIAGYVGGAGKKYWEEIRRRLGWHITDDSVDFVGEVDRKEKLDFLRSLHVLSVPTAHPEPKGFFVLEAMACGVPVVQPNHGSFPELIEATGGGRLYDPANAQKLGDAIAELMDDAALRNQLAQSGLTAVRTKHTDEIMASKAWSVYERYMSSNVS